ncbi:hypothetical protein D3C78_1964410 [compost metagenome]
MPLSNRTSSKIKNSDSGAKNAAVPMPLSFKYSSARTAILRGSLSYLSPSGVNMSQNTFSVG